MINCSLSGGYAHAIVGRGYDRATYVMVLDLFDILKT